MTDTSTMSDGSGVAAPTIATEQLAGAEDFSHLKTKVVVAPGRTVDASIGWKVESFDANGNPVKREKFKTFRPGEEFELPIDEADRLRSIGHVI